LGQGLLGANAFGGSSSAFNGGSEVSVGQVPRLTNLGLVDVVEELTPKSSVTMAAGYGLVHFYGELEDITFVGSSEFTAQAAYDRILNAKDQVALSYGYQGFNFSTVDSAFHSNVIQAMYGHRISGRMDFLIGAGPQFTHFDANQPVCMLLGFPVDVSPSQCDGTGETLGLPQPPEAANHIGVAGRVSLRYRFPRTSLSLSFQRYNTDGSGIYAGSLSNIAHLSVRRPLNRVWDLFADVGYSKNVRLQIPGSAVSASSFSYGYGGVGVHRQLGRSLRAFISYQYNYLTFNTGLCPAGSSLIGGTCVNGDGVNQGLPSSNNSQRQVGSIGLDWTPRPIRLD
jgi:hypothetical protein